MKVYLFLGLAFTPISWAVDLSPPAIDVTRFLPAFEQVLQDVKSPEFDSAHCVSYLNTLENRILALHVSEISSVVFERDAQIIADTSWKIREALHGRLEEFDLSCLNQVQANFRQFRFIEDYILERVRNVTHLYPEKRNFQNEPFVPMKDAVSYYAFQIRSDRPDLSAHDLLPGDLLVARGVSFLSAMIARLGERLMQFSHLLMVADPGPIKTMTGQSIANTPRTLESYVGSGVAFYELDEALKNENPRLLWLRSKDKNLARKAAKIMSDEVSLLSSRNEKIFYDYDLDFKDHESMSCPEVPQVGYEKASNGSFRIPLYPSKITGTDDLLTHFGLPDGETFQPGDMEIDPRFELMGEFRDLRFTRDSRHKDVIMSKIFEWMNDKNYRLHDSRKSKLAGGVIYKVRRTFLWPLVKRLLKLDDFSTEIPKKMIKTVQLLGEIGEPMLKRLRERDDAFKAATGWSMSYQELYQALEEFRIEDESLYQSRKTRKNSQFHRYFRAGR